MNTHDKQAELAATTQVDPRWAMLQARDAAAGGTFFYSVKAAGVYCRPSCGARPAEPKNVAFHATAADTRRVGFRHTLGIIFHDVT